MITIGELMKQSHETATEKGWWEKDCPECGADYRHFVDAVGDDPETILCPHCIKGKIPNERSFGDTIALMHSELSEALEHYRNGELLTEIWAINPDTGKKKDESEIEELGLKPDGIAVEFADVLIRIFDNCEHYGIPLERALSMKMAYNKTRPYRHGGKKS